MKTNFYFRLFVLAFSLFLMLTFLTLIFSISAQAKNTDYNVTEVPELIDVTKWQKSAEGFVIVDLRSQPIVLHVVIFGETNIEKLRRHTVQVLYDQNLD